MESKKVAYRDIGQFLKDFEEYSLSEALYTISIEAGIKKPSDFLERTDDELITAIEQAKTKEYA